jgi:aminopeptidase N
MLALARLDTAFVFRSPAFFAILFLGLVNAMTAMFFGDDIYGSPSYPVTRLMVETLENAFGLFTVLIAGFYAGELVWRDRERRLHEIVDAAPVPDWAHVAPKILAIAGVLLATLLMGVLGGIFVQIIRGYLHFQVGAYMLWFVWPWLVRSVLIAVLAVFVQVVVPHKAIGWAVMLLYLVAMFALPNAGLDHHLYLYGTAPRVPLSDMDGMGRFWIGRVWFEVYWSAFAAILVLLSYALWRHGETVALRLRLRQLKHRLRGSTLAALAVAVALWLGSGAWIYYNTNVLNAYASQRAHDHMLADYERTLLKYERVPQPRVADVSLDVQLYPRQARALTSGRYTLVNRTQAPIDRIYLQWWERLQLDSVTLDGATVEHDWPRFHYRIYRLARPIQPGETRTLGFTSTLEAHGFPNESPLTQIVENGSFFDNWKIAPALGFSRAMLLEDRARRRSQGLPPELRMDKLEDDSANARNALSSDSDWVAADITVTTDADQTPVAPGRAVSDTTTTMTDGVVRRTVHFRSDAPINQYFSIQSARYDIRRTTWASPTGGVDLAVYFHPGHEFNVTRMLDGMRLALALYSEKFSPFQFEQMRIVEFPYARYAEAYANTIPYSERIGFVQDWTDSRKIDIATYVTAHEVAHQWWAHQLVPADKQGAAMLTESFAQYSALLTMERLYGPDAVRRFLKYELDAYLAARGSEPLEELPLERVEAQRYIYYSKGSLVMYWAKEALGEETIDRAMRKLLAAHAFKGPPYADTREFIALLRAEAKPEQQAIITDLFERITLYDLKATNGRATKRADGRYDVSFDVESHKFYADGFGKETEAPMDEPVELGAFTDSPAEKDFKAADRLWLEQRRVRSGVMHVTAVVDKAPKWVGIDPYNKRIDRNSDDNLAQVEVRPE